MYCNGFDWHAASPLWRKLNGLAAPALGLEPTVVSLLGAFLAMCAIGAAVRLMDDLLDAGIDAERDICTVAAKWGEATLPYAMALFACAAALVPRMAVSLFAAAYAVGMAGDGSRRLLLGLNGWQEGLLMALLGVAGAGVAGMSWALAFIFSLQAYDDIVDQRADCRAGSRNWCLLFGVGEVSLAGICALLLSIALSPALTLLGWLALLGIQALLPRHVKQGGAVNG